MSRFSTELYEKCQGAKKGSCFNLYGFNIELLSDFENDKCKALVGMADEVFSIKLDHVMKEAELKNEGLES